jgi:ribonuclease-3
MNIIKKYLLNPVLQKGFFNNEKILGFPPSDLDCYRKAFTSSSNKLSSDGNPINYDDLNFGMPC